MLQSQCYSGMMKNINHITPMGLNRNIGCIEIRFHAYHAHKQTKLNRNIGCIEIFYDKFKERFVKGVEP